MDSLCEDYPAFSSPFLVPWELPEHWRPPPAPIQVIVVNLFQQMATQHTVILLIKDGSSPHAENSLNTAKEAIWDHGITLESWSPDWESTSILSSSSGSFLTNCLVLIKCFKAVSAAEFLAALFVRPKTNTCLYRPIYYLFCENVRSNTMVQFKKEQHRLSGALLKPSLIPIDQNGTTRKTQLKY